MMIAILAVAAALVGSSVSLCPEFETFSSLDLAKFSGNWQIQGMIRSEEREPIVQCLEVNFASNNWSVAPVTVNTTLNAQYIQTGATFSLVVPTTIPSLSCPRVWNVNIYGTASVYSVLDVNYSTYSLSVACATINDVDELFVFFNTRSHDPIPSDTVENYKGILRGYGINTDHYFEIIHDRMICGHHA